MDSLAPPMRGSSMLRRVVDNGGFSGETTLRRAEPRVSIATEHCSSAAYLRIVETRRCSLTDVWSRETAHKDAPDDALLSSVCKALGRKIVNS